MGIFNSKYTDHSFNPKNCNWDTGPCEWKRLTDIDPNAKFFIDGTDPSDICQGSIGDCYFLSAVATICKNPKILKKVFVSQNPKKGKYSFRFYDIEKKCWKTVTVDDYLIVRPNSNTLICARSSDPHEYWVSLLEKAYAKFKGGWNKISNGGLPHESLQELTGGEISERIIIQNYRGDLWLYMKSNAKTSSGSFLCCYTRYDTRGTVDQHAYSILRCVEVKQKGKSLKLLQIRNPWGKGGEWQGDYSDSSDKWTGTIKLPTNIIDELRDVLGVPKGNVDDGTFWMSYEDFVKHWHGLYTCVVRKKKISESKQKNIEKSIVKDDSWITKCFFGCAECLHIGKEKKEKQVKLIRWSKILTLISVIFLALSAILAAIAGKQGGALTAYWIIVLIFGLLDSVIGVIPLITSFMNSEKHVVVDSF